MKFRGLLIIFVLIGLCCQSVAQKTLLLNKPGTFKIDKHALNGLGEDQYGENCNCTSAESVTALKQLDKLVATFRQCPVLNEIKGFDGICDIGGGRCNSKFGYGVPATVNFFFKSWSLRKGKEEQWIYEPPQWWLEVNMTEKFCSNGFNETDFSNAYNPTNPAFSEQKMHEATVAIRELFFLPGVKEQVSSGIDRYGDNLIIFNPDRPAYWEQVTIREVFHLLLDYWKVVPDKIQMETMVPILEKELSNFSEAEKDGFAYFGNPETIYKIGSDKNETPVMRPNPEYWNRNLPRNAVQFMWLEIPKKEEVKQRLDGNLKAGDGYYFVYRLLNELDIQTLIPLIEK